MEAEANLQNLPAFWGPDASLKGHLELPGAKRFNKNMFLMFFLLTHWHFLPVELEIRFGNKSRGAHVTITQDLLYILEALNSFLYKQSLNRISRVQQFFFLFFF